jgi:hypothetical protein
MHDFQHISLYIPYISALSHKPDASHSKHVIIRFAKYVTTNMPPIQSQLPPGLTPAA